MTENEVLESLKQSMLSELHLEDVSEDDMTPDTMLFDENEGLRLDSLDAVELVVLIEKHFGVQIKNPDDARSSFATLGTLAAFIHDNTTAERA